MTTYEWIFFIETLVVISLYAFSAVDWFLFSKRSRATGVTLRFLLAIAGSTLALGFNRWVWLSVIGQAVVHRLYPQYVGASAAVLFSLWLINEILSFGFWGYLVWLLRGGDGGAAAREQAVIDQMVLALLAAANSLPAGEARQKVEAAIEAYEKA